MKKTLLMCLMAIISMSLYAKTTWKTVSFKVEQMVCITCEKKVKKNMAFEKGVKRLSTDVPNHIVTIEYDPQKTNIEKLQAGFRKFGYSAVEIPQNTQKSTPKT